MTTIPDSGRLLLIVKNLGKSNGRWWSPPPTRYRPCLLL